MKQNKHLEDPKRSVGIFALAASLALILSSCAGAEGSSVDSAGDDTGFEYGASQDEVNQVIEDLESTTITFQPVGQSENSAMAPAGTVFKEMVEERSNGKITVDIVWAQAIAGYDEMHDALADGRIDIAYTIPPYEPSRFPVANDMGTVMAGLSSSPLLGELVANSVGIELGWQNERLLEEFENEGLTPLTPASMNGGYYTVCGQPLETSEGWNGIQARVPMTAHDRQVAELGGTGVSLAYTETFEGLQRGTVDCTIDQLFATADGGLIEVAPHIGYTTDSSFSRMSGAYLAGASFKELPLAYQQIIFDSHALANSGVLQAVIGGNKTMIAAAKEQGGSVAPLSDQVQHEISTFSQELTQEAINNGTVDEDFATQRAEAEEKWRNAVEELGYSADGSVEEFDTWYDDSSDFLDWATYTYENSGALDHRPE